MKPRDVKIKHVNTILMRLNSVKCVKNNPTLMLGDSVRVSKNKNTFRIGYLPNWTNKVFKFHATRPTRPVKYVLEIRGSQRGSSKTRFLFGRNCQVQYRKLVLN